MRATTVLATLIASLFFLGCSCTYKPRAKSSQEAVAVPSASAAEDAGMVVYRDPETGEITDAPADGDLRPQPPQPSSAERPSVESAPGGGVMIKTDKSLEPY